MLFMQRQGGVACHPSSAVGFHDKSRGETQTCRQEQIILFAQDNLV